MVNIEFIERLRCPRCGGLNTYFRTLSNSMKCKRCGYEFFRPDESVLGSKLLQKHSEQQQQQQPSQEL